MPDVPHADALPGEGPAWMAALLVEAAAPSGPVALAV